MEVRRYEDGTHDTIAPALKATEMVGMAVAMMTVSRVDTTMHSDSPRKHAMILFSGSRLVWSVSSTSARTFVAVTTATDGLLALVSQVLDVEGFVSFPCADILRSRPKPRNFFASAFIPRDNEVCLFLYQEFAMTLEACTGVTARHEAL